MGWAGILKPANRAPHKIQDRQHDFWIDGAAHGTQIDITDWGTMDVDIDTLSSRAHSTDDRESKALDTQPVVVVAIPPSDNKQTASFVDWRWAAFSYFQIILMKQMDDHSSFEELQQADF